MPQLKLLIHSMCSATKVLHEAGSSRNNRFYHFAGHDAGQSTLFMSKPGFSIVDLQQGAKKLNSVPASAADSKESRSTHVEADQGAIQRLEDLYVQHGGDLDAIFGELGADPSKAKKPHHRPKGANEFAVKYLQGYYSIIDAGDTVAESKASHKDAVLLGVCSTDNNNRAVWKTVDHLSYSSLICKIASKHNA